MGIGISAVNVNSNASRNTSVSFGARPRTFSAAEEDAIRNAFTNRFGSGRSLDNMFEEAQSSLGIADDYLMQQSCSRENQLKQEIWRKIGGKGRMPDIDSLTDIKDYYHRDLYRVAEYTDPKIVKVCLDLGIPTLPTGVGASGDSEYAKFLARLDKEIEVQKQSTRVDWAINGDKYMFKQAGIHAPMSSPFDCTQAFIKREIAKLYRMKAAIVEGTREELEKANRILVKMYKNANPELKLKEVMHDLRGTLFKIKK